MFKLFVIFIIFSILSNCYLVLSYKFDVYYNLVLVGSASEVVSDLCRNELSQIANGIDGREIWAMKSEFYKFGNVVFVILCECDFLFGKF